MELYEGILYVAGSGGFMWRYNGSWSQSSDVTNLDTAVVFWTTPDGVISQRLIIQDTATSFRHIAEGSTPMVLAQYSARYQIAGGSYRINSIAAANQTVWFATAGGLATVDSRGYSPIVNPYLKNMFSNDLNGEFSIYHDGYVYMSTFQGLDRVDVSSQQRQDTPAAVQPGAGTSAEHPIYGRATAGCADGGYLLTAFYNGTDSYVLAGKPDGSHPSGMRWYGSEYHLAGERITHMRIHVTSPASNPCLWVASVAGSTPHLRYVFLPKGATPQQELLNNLSPTTGAYTGSMRWAEEWKVFFGAQDLGDQNSKKLVERYDASSRRLTATTYFRVFANAEGGPYVQQGTGADPQIKTSPRAQLIPTAPLTEAYNLGVRLDGYGATTAPAMLNQLKGRFELIQEMRNNTTYQLSLGPVEVTRAGAHFDRAVLDTLDVLLSLQSRGPTSMVDQYGNTLPAVKVEPGITWAPRRVERSGVSTEDFELVATVSISTVPTTEEQLSSGSAAPPAAVFPALIWDESNWDESSWAERMARELEQVPDSVTLEPKHVQQIIASWLGLAGDGTEAQLAGVPLRQTSVKDAVLYALDARNRGTGGLHIRATHSSGSPVLFSVTDAGVLASVSGEAASNPFVYPSMVVGWTAPLATIPAGYSVVAASQGRFPYGASVDGDLGATGGSATYDVSHTHTGPSHSHDGLTGAAGTSATGSGGAASTDNANPGDTALGGALSTDNANAGDTALGGALSTDNTSVTTNLGGAASTDNTSVTTNLGGALSTDNDGAFSGNTGNSDAGETDPTTDIRSVTDTTGVDQVDVADDTHTHGTTTHNHSITIGSHDHTIDQHTHVGPSHDHDIATHSHVGPSHDHDIAQHFHNMAGTHDHNIDQHLHTMSSHDHDIASHTHSGPSHDHSISAGGTGNTGSGGSATQSVLPPWWRCYWIERD